MLTWMSHYPMSRICGFLPTIVSETVMSVMTTHSIAFIRNFALLLKLHEGKAAYVHEREREKLFFTMIRDIIFIGVPNASVLVLARKSDSFQVGFFFSRKSHKCSCIF